MPAELLLRLDRVSVHYGATRALDGVYLELRAGEVHALIGENGAGKSTLLRLATGMADAVAGALWIAPGKTLDWAPQEPLLAPDLTACEWIFLGRERRGRLGWLRRAEMHREAEGALREIGGDIDPDLRLGDLSAVQRKQVQLARALHANPDILLLDEPTAALGTGETRRLFALLRARRGQGCAVLYVTHRLDEVRALADRVTVLRDGRHVSTDPIDDIDDATLVRRMVGRDLAARPPGERSRGDVTLRVRALSVAQVEAVDLEVRRGEIVGLAGLVGAGRSETLEAIAGLRRRRGGRVEGSAPPVFVPEDRGRKGLIPTFDVRENICLPPGAWWLDRRGERTQTETWIAELAIHGSGPEAAIDSLSGGNQQKVLLARALRHRPALLLLDEPTAGVDVGAKAEIHAIVRRLAEGGTAVLLASSDLLELLVLCDRIVALREGRVAGEVAASTASEANLGALITGTAVDTCA